MWQYTQVGALGVDETPTKRITVNWIEVAFAAAIATVVGRFVGRMIDG